MMIDKRLIGTVPESKKIHRRERGAAVVRLCGECRHDDERSFAAGGVCLDGRLLTTAAVAAVLVRYLCTTGAARMSDLSSRAVKKTLRTQMYKKHLDSFVKKKGMTVRTKAGILLSVTVLMAVRFFFMMRKSLPVPCILLAVVWVRHVIYFVFGVKTITEAESTAEAPQA